MKKEKTLYILSGGRVAAIEKETGFIQWEVKLKAYVSSSYANSIGQIVAEDNKLFISVAGIVLCLNAKDGALIWKNELKGWGYKYVSMANTGSEAAAISAQAAAHVATTVAATT
jgi:outer membrane protein assembly factor BamB